MGHLGRGVLLWLAASCGCASVHAPRGEQTKAARPPSITASSANFATRQALVRREEELRRLLLQQPHDALSYRELGENLERQGKLHAAEKSLARAVELDPNDVAARCQWARMLDRSGDHRGAVREARRAVRQAPDWAPPHALLGMLLLKSGEGQGGIESLEKAWKCHPPSVEAGLELARRDEAQGHHADALSRLAICLVHDPNRSETRQRYAACLAAQGRFQEAAEQLERLVRSGEGSVAIHYRLAEIYRRLGDTERSLDQWVVARRLGGDPAWDGRLRKMMPEGRDETVPAEYRPLLPNPAAEGSSNRAGTSM